jgi:hypothetical protein
MAGTEDELQRAVYALNSVAIKCTFEILVYKSKAMAVKVKMNVRTKIVINNNITDQANSFNCLRHTVTVTNNRDLEIKTNRFNQMCNAVRTTLNNKTRK